MIWKNWISTGIIGIILIVIILSARNYLLDLLNGKSTEIPLGLG